MHGGSITARPSNQYVNKLHLFYFITFLVGYSLHGADTARPCTLRYSESRVPLFFTLIRCVKDTRSSLARSIFVIADISIDPVAVINQNHHNTVTAEEKLGILYCN